MISMAFSVRLEGIGRNQALSLAGISTTFPLNLASKFSTEACWRAAMGFW